MRLPYIMYGSFCHICIMRNQNMQDDVLVFHKNQLLVRSQDTLSFMRCGELPERHLTSVSPMI